LRCQDDSTSIREVQGEDWYSPLQGERLSIRGIVTRVESGHGFYLEEPSPGTASRSSSAMFVSDEALSTTVSAGQELRISGQVTESGKARDKMTSLSDISAHELCNEHAKLPFTQAALPMNARDREALEGMRVNFAQPLAISDVYNLHKGELTLSSGGMLRVPTEIRDPGAEAMEQGEENQRRSLKAILPPDEESAWPVGTGFQNLTGLMGHDGTGQRFMPSTMPVPSLPATRIIASPATDHIRVVSINLLNFFNGDGLGGGFPTVRGARTPSEFQAQKSRIQATLGAIQADLFGVQELENDGFGPNSAAQELREILEEAGGGRWSFISPSKNRIGGDVITVGIFYRESSLEAIGSAHLLGSSEFQGLSRYPLAQVFRDKRTGEDFLVVVNHLKSKYGCPETGKNSDQQDGQGCWNQARVAAVQAQVPWIEEIAAQSGTRRILILGDMNAWRQEDPIRQFEAYGLIDLVEKLSGLPQHSFLYWGQSGTLDYAFASPALLANTRRAEIWNINADWPAKMALPQPWLRMSDHDPVIVDFDFSQSSASD